MLVMKNTNRTRSNLALVLLVFCLLIVASSVGKSQVIEVNRNPLLDLLPDLGSSPAPEWVLEGLRATYYAASASSDLWRNPDMATASGASLWQIDVVERTQDMVATFSKMYIGLDSGTTIPSTVMGEINTPGAGDFWVSPGVLPAALTLEIPGFTAFKAPITIEGREYRAIRFEYNTGQAKYVWYWEEGTGLLLLYRHYLLGATAEQRSHVEFRGLRQLNVPRTELAVRPPVGPGSEISFRGQVAVKVPGAPGLPIASVLSFRTIQVEASAVKFSVKQTLAGQSEGQARIVTGPAQIFDSPWLAPQSLEMLTPGTVLDRDPYTGIETSVANGKEFGFGDDVLLLRQESSDYLKVLGYDASGLLIYIYEEYVVNPVIYSTHVAEYRRIY